MTKLIMSMMLFAAFGIAVLVATGADTGDYVAATIALLALVVSIVSAFKEDVFPFRTDVLIAEVVVAAPTGPSHDSLALVLPIHFVNTGHGGGVVEGLSLKVEHANRTKIYTPVAEINYEKLVGGRRALHADNTLGAFRAFPMGPKSTAQKSILFTQEEGSQKYPFNAWAPGSHLFRLFAKFSNGDRPVDVASVTHVVSDGVLQNYKQGVTTSLNPKAELDV
jgi:hypothetical protein